MSSIGLGLFLFKEIGKMVENPVSNFQEKDISAEEYREYEYTDGLIIKITEPKTLYLFERGSARVLDKEGVVHYIPGNFKKLRWKGPVLF